MNTMTKNDEMVSAFAPPEDREKPAPLVPLGLGNMQLEQRPVGAIKVAVERDEARILQRLRVFAAAAGEEFFYRFPVKTKGGGTDYIEGPSIKCALAVARAYGNCDIDVRTNDAGDSWLFYARFVDFETGFTMTRAFQQRKSQQTMKTDNGRALDIVFQIGQSKAIRNVVCNALGMFTDFAFEEAKNAIVSRVGKNLENYRTKVLSRLSDMKIDVKRVETVLGRSADKWLAPDVARIIAEIQAINDGMALGEDLYPPLNGVPDKKPERTDFVDTKPEQAKEDVALTDDEEREAARLMRESQEGNLAETGEASKPDPVTLSQDFEDYFGKVAKELSSAPDEDTANAIDEAVRSSITGAQERKELSSAQVDLFAGRWNTVLLERLRALQKTKNGKGKK